MKYSNGSISSHTSQKSIRTYRAFKCKIFMAFDENTEPLWWFGWGFDMTPFYPFLEDVVLWHESAQKICVLDKKLL